MRTHVIFSLRIDRYQVNLFETLSFLILMEIEAMFETLALRTLSTSLHAHPRVHLALHNLDKHRLYANYLACSLSLELGTHIL
jgi:hypothetical protein